MIRFARSERLQLSRPARDAHDDKLKFPGQSLAGNKEGKLMKRILSATFLGISLFASVAFGQQPSEAPLTNTSVIKLVKAGFKEKTVIAIISNRPSLFRLDPEQLIQLKRQGVSENVILAMLASQDAAFAVSDDDWSNDQFFFKGLNKGSNNGDSPSSGTGIFGSGASSKSQSQSRGGRGGNENEGNITGSATVRILKPAVEGDSAAPKLERVPTLNNEAIIRLVEAGFSEGTIIKRIEDSSVEFDLSPAKVDELHKRRVTDLIITAMTAAMGDKEN